MLRIGQTKNLRRKYEFSKLYRYFRILLEEINLILPSDGFYNEIIIQNINQKNLFALYKNKIDEIDSL